MPSTDGPASAMNRMVRSSPRLDAVLEEFQNLHLRLQLALWLAALLPPFVANRLRARVLRIGGLRIGGGTVIGGSLSISGSIDPAANVEIGSLGWINGGCVIDVSAPVSIGDNVAIGHQVLLLTNTHEMGDGTQRASSLRAAPIRICDGAWIGARVVVLPGVTIGAGAVVAAGSVVTSDVAPHTLVAGVPARPKRELAP